MLNVVGNIGLAAIKKITDLWSAGTSDSLIDYTSVSRVEPIVLIDSDALYHEALSQVQQSLLAQFAGYYLQAIAISATVGKVSVTRHLDKLNPTRNPVNAAVNSIGYLIAAENYTHRLPVYGENKPRLALEANPINEFNNDDGTESGFTVGKDTTTVIRELSDLSVGKLFTVEITDGMHKASVPISIRLMASQLPSANLVNILGINNQDNSTKERYYAWKDGRIEFIKDLVLCQDLIEAHKKNLMNDKQGIYSEILKRRRSNQVSGLVSGNPSVATASNIVIITDDTLDALQMKINGKMSDFKTREKVFKETYIMIMAVIDKRWNRVTFYHRGISTHTELGMSDLKSSSKGNGPDVSEILKAYSQGISPSL